MAPVIPAHIGNELAQFGTDWLYVVVPGLFYLAVGHLIARQAPACPTEVGWLQRVMDGASRITGLPVWAGGPLVVLVPVLLYAVQGFFWDVAWHIDIGRDEFLFSPPHVCLLLGVSGMGVVGGLSVWQATRSDAPVGWKIGRWRVPLGAAPLLAMGVAATVGWGVDELWHWAYGLDVTMWSPPHLTMISSAVFSPFAAWLLYAEATSSRPTCEATRFRRAGDWRARVTVVLLGGVLLTATSAWQLEFDLGVPQWQLLWQPLLIAVAAAVSLVITREAFGRGGALAAVGVFLLLRWQLALLTSEVWGLSYPRFPLYLAAAVAVEVVYLAGRDRRGPVPLALAAGGGVGTVGLAGEWLWGQVGFYHPWGAGLWPSVLVASGAAVAAAVLGVAFGRIVSHRPAGIPPRLAVVAGLALFAAAAVAVPRNVPPVEARVMTTPVADGWVDVEVALDPPDAAARATRFEIMSWQGGGKYNRRLVEVERGRYVADGPVPVGGTWKSMVRLERGSELGAIPIFLPWDAEIDAAEVPVVPVREQAFVDEQQILLREAHDGPVWPGVVGYLWVVGSIGSIIGLNVAGAVAMERRRRRRQTASAPAGGSQLVGSGGTRPI